MPHHLERVPESPPGEPSTPEPDDMGVYRDEAPDPETLVRPTWWRWLAVIVALALVVATPFAYALSRLLD